MGATMDDAGGNTGAIGARAYWERRRYGRMPVPVETRPRHLAALERLALLDTGDRDKACIAWAVSRFMDAGAHVSALGDALWPADEEEAEQP